MSDQTQTIPIESFSGEQLCRVPLDMSDEYIKVEIQSLLETDSTIKLFRHDDVVMYGIVDDRSILLGFDGVMWKVNWDMQTPCEKWFHCQFNGTTLVKLDLSDSTRTLPSGLGNLRNLQIFDCSYSELAELPSELGQLTNLQKLDCSDNELTGLPSELGQLTNLQTLNCSSNALTELPLELGNLRNLRELIVFTNQLTQLPSELGNLRNLRMLSCGANKLEELPSELGQLTNLKKVFCRSNFYLVVPLDFRRLLGSHGCIVKDMY